MRIFYEDEYILVCLKEAGIAVEDANISRRDLVSELKNYLGGGYLGVIHRLDMPVEGLLVFAKTKDVAARLSSYLSTGALNKDYHAIVCGKPTPPSGTLVDFLGVSKLSPKGGKKAVVSRPEDKEARKAVLNYKVLGSEKIGDKEISLLDVSIETGRFHQIRAQLSNINCPIVGDKKYGTNESEGAADELGIRNVALYADRISFIHPKTGKKLEFGYVPNNKVIKELLG